MAVATLTNVFAAHGADRAAALPRVELASGGVRLVARLADLPVAGVHGAVVASLAPAGSHPLTVLYERATGAPVALVASGPLVALAAVAATVVAATVLAPCGADTVGVLGSGPQARNQVRAACHAFPVRRAVLWSPCADHRERAAAALTAELGVEVRAGASPEEAVRASLVMTAARSLTPVLHGAWLRPGTHVTSVGADAPGKRELAATAVERADRLVVDDLAHPRAGVGDVAAAVAEGVDRRDDVVELGDVLAGTAPGRTSDDEVTVFAAMGSAVAGLALAAAVVGAAVQAGVGRDLGDLG